MSGGAFYGSFQVTQFVDVQKESLEQVEQLVHIDAVHIVADPILSTSVQHSRPDPRKVIFKPRIGR